MKIYQIDTFTVAPFNGNPAAACHLDKLFACFPLSESWRRRKNKSIDFFCEVLSVLSRAAV